MLMLLSQQQGQHHDGWAAGGWALDLLFVAEAVFVF
jgi:hypothetical protein